jgi:hypothetical protein
MSYRIFFSLALFFLCIEHMGMSGADTKNKIKDNKIEAICTPPEPVKTQESKDTAAKETSKTEPDKVSGHKGGDSCQPFRKPFFSDYHFEGDFLDDAGFTQGDQAPRTYYWDLPYAKIYNDVTLFSALKFHSLIKLPLVETPAIHWIDFTEAYFTTLGKRFQLRFGKGWLPFSDYATLLYVSPLTKRLGHTNQYYMAGMLNSAHTTSKIYVFQPYNVIKNGTKVGYGADFQYHLSDHLTLGTSYISSIADSFAMQYNVYTGGFLNQNLEEYTPAVSVYMHLTINNFYLYGTSIMTIQAFSPQDLMFDDKGARPSATSIEGGYKFKMGSHDAALIARTEWTKELLALGFPEKVITVGFNVQLTQYALFQAQFYHNYNYPTSETGCMLSTRQCLTGKGGFSNAVLLGLTFIGTAQGS